MILAVKFIAATITIWQMRQEDVWVFLKKDSKYSHLSAQSVYSYLNNNNLIKTSENFHFSVIPWNVRAQ